MVAGKVNISDRVIPDMKPRHLYSGKMGRGTRDWR